MPRNRLIWPVTIFYPYLFSLFGSSKCRKQLASECILINVSTEHWNLASCSNFDFYLWETETTSRQTKQPKSKALLVDHRGYCDLTNSGAKTLKFVLRVVQEKRSWFHKKIQVENISMVWFETLMLCNSLIFNIQDCLYFLNKPQYLSVFSILFSATDS